MSATVEADIFSQYFGGCPCVTIPGYTFPVDICYLEDAISLAKYDPKRGGGQQPRQNPGGRPGGGGRGSGARTCRCSGAALFRASHSQCAVLSGSFPLDLLDHGVDCRNARMSFRAGKCAAVDRLDQVPGPDQANRRSDRRGHRARQARVSMPMASAPAPHVQSSMPSGP